MEKTGRLRSQLGTVGAILTIILVLQLIYTRRDGGFTQLEPRDGVLDITGIDFSDTVYTIANDWDFYPNRLYSHEDFLRGVEPPWEISPGNIPYGTHRLVIQGPPGAYLTICGYSVDYGSRIYVDGQEVFTCGHVTEDPDTSVPKTGYLTVPICLGDDGEAELICQYNNFVHTDGGTIHATYLSTPQNIDEYQTGNSVVSVTLGGGLLTVSLYFFLKGAVQHQRSYLILAFCCLIFSMRDQLFFFLSLMPRSLPWETEYRIYISVVNLLPVSLLVLLETLYPVAKRWANAAFWTMVIFFMLLIWVLGTKLLHMVNVYSYFCCIPYLSYLVFGIGKRFWHQKCLEPGDGAALMGFGILLLSLVLEGLMTFRSAKVVRYGFTPTAMLIFLFLIAISISQRIQAQEAVLAESRSRSQMLEKINKMNLDFLRKVAHELKTPLTIISGYAQLTGMQLEREILSNETPENLKTIQREAQRLGDLVTTLKDYSYTGGTETIFTGVSIRDLLDRVEAICRPLAMKNNNNIVITGRDCADVRGNGELLLQIFINLVVNSSRHTQNGTITVSTAEDEEPGVVVFRVADTGTGIPEALREGLFEKGTSGDGGSGLGLAICQEAVQAHGGTLTLERTDSTGTVFRFTVPKKGGSL